MADTKTTALDAFTPILTDILYGVDDPGGTPVGKKLTITALRTLVEANLTTAVAATGFDISTDVKLRRDGAGILALRNGTNAQEVRVYNTFTDASNYERGVIKWASNVLEIGMEHAGTGVQRLVQFHRGGVDHIQLNGKVLLQRDVVLSSNMTLSEASAPAAPGANDGKFFMGDNNGKTECRILFNSGASVLIAAEPA